MHKLIKFFYFVLIIALSVIISIVGVVATLHACFVNSDHNWFMELACGDLGQFNGVSFWLNRDNVLKIYSNVPEAMKDRLAENLFDDNPQTLAEPTGNKFDYVIEFPDLYKIQRINLWWGDFGLGSSTGHIDKWALEARSKGDEWVAVASGLIPEEEITFVKTDIITSALRVRAEAKEAWIGIYDVKIMATP